MRRLPFAILFCLALACSDAKQPDHDATPTPDEPRRLPGVEAIDLFGTRQITLEQILDRHESAVIEVIDARAGDDEDRFRTAWLEMGRRINEMGDFADVDFSFINYFGNDTGTYLTIDIVDEKDREQRMAFAPEPTGSFEDPGGLLAAWEDYEEIGWPLLTSGRIEQPVRCPAYHCVFGFDEPGLALFEERFESGVPQQRDRLVEILQGDGDEDKRATAAFLLAHLDDGDDVVGLMLGSFDDGSSRVRNNVMRVIALLADAHPENEVPLGPAIRALHYPSTTDRNKAAAILAARCERPETHEAILRGAGPRLLEMLALWQPNNHNYAYRILKQVSGEDYDERDYAAWNKWLERNRFGH